MNAIGKWGFLLMAATLSGCAYVRPKVGLGWEYRYQMVSPDRYKIHVEESRFSSEGDADNLFRVASAKVSDANHCRDYRIIAYSSYLDYAFLGAAIPVIDGEITCLR